MKTKVFALLLISGIFTLAVIYDADYESPPSKQLGVSLQIAEVAPVLSFKTLEGVSHTWQELPEQGVLVHFWASWCAPCKTEFPSLLQNIKQANGRLGLVAISIDENEDAMHRFMTQLPQGLQDNPHVYWVWDRDKTIALQSFNTMDVPETILLDRHRKMIQKIVGDPGWAGKDMADVLTSLAQ